MATSLQSAVQRVLARRAGLHVFRTLPHGVDVARDIERLLPSCRITEVLDVGANLGQSANRFLVGFPDAQIHCIEPARTTFEQLRRTFATEPRVQCHQVALGSSEGEAEIVHQGGTRTFYVAGQSEKTAPPDGTGVETIMVTTADTFCAEHGLDRIGFMKIDTEGGDLDVLAGAAGMLGEQRVDVVQVEAGTNPENDWHCSLGDLTAFLESTGYRLFGFYEQMREWPTGRPNLRRTDAAFVSRRVIEADARQP